MKIGSRRLIYSFFFLLFFISAPLAIIYALGFRYNFVNNIVEKTGAFYIKSYPRSADIYINNVKSRHKTPNQLTNIRPDIYTVKIVKDKYTAWEKQLPVYSGETTFVEDVVLFLENKEKTDLGLGSTEFLINHNNNQYAYLDNKNQLFITNVEQEKNFAIHTFDKKYNLIDWSPDNQYILLQDSLYNYIFDINQKKIDRLTINSKDEIIWDNKDSNILWYLEDKQLFRYNIQIPDYKPQVIDTLNNKDLKDFVLWDDYLIIHYSIKNNYYIEQLDKNNLLPTQLIENVNLGKLDVLLADNRQLIFTLSSKLYIKDVYQDPIIIPITIAKLHGDRILMTNGHEITLYNYKDNWQELIDRSSQIVSDILWHPNGSYFVSEINEKTRITELDYRDKRNYVELLENPWKKLYLFNSKGDKLFILTPEENFYLTIQ